MILVDSSVWIDYFNGIISPQTSALENLLGAQDIFVGDIILTEVLQGFRQEKHFLKAKELMERFSIVSMVGSEIALLAAKNYRQLRKRGITNKTIDIIIATYCIHNNATLLHSDSDFVQMEKYLKLKSFKFLYH